MIIPELTAEFAAFPPGLVAGLGLTSGLAFPAVGSDGTVAVAAFYGARPLETSERLMQKLESDGYELGRFLELRGGQFEPRGLTARELEILRHAADGKSGPEIATLLVISPSTVKTHFENIYDEARRLRSRGRRRIRAAQRTDRVARLGARQRAEECPDDPPLGRCSLPSNAPTISSDVAFALSNAVAGSHRRVGARGTRTGPGCSPRDLRDRRRRRDHRGQLRRSSP